MEAPPRLELGIKALQASALPLGYGAESTKDGRVSASASYHQYMQPKTLLIHRKTTVRAIITGITATWCYHPSQSVIALKGNHHKEKSLQRDITPKKKGKRRIHYASFHQWSGRRDSNPRRSPWQGDALPLSHSRISKNGASGWNRTADTGIFSPLLYRLSYRGAYMPVEKTTVKIGDPEGTRTLDL